MKKLFTLGDLHFGVAHDFDVEAINKFIDWFDSYDFGKKEDIELIQLGDIVDKASNIGDTIEFVTKLFSIASNKFKKVYILGGNHCHKLYKEKPNYASSYLKYMFNIETIFSEKLFTTENGFSVIALPHKRVNGKNLDEYYSKNLSKEFYETEVDLICGHVALKEEKSFFGGIDINNFKAKNRAFGHIHSRIGKYKEDYTGSIMSFKISEQKTDLPRCIKVLCDNKTVSEINIPQIIDYNTLKFGDIPQFKKESDSLVHLYIVSNCKNLNQAKNFYPEYYIYNIEKAIKQETTKISSKDVFITPKEALRLMIKEQKIVLKRKVLNILDQLLS